VWQFHLSNQRNTCSYFMKCFPPFANSFITTQECASWIALSIVKYRLRTPLFLTIAILYIYIQFGVSQSLYAMHDSGFCCCGGGALERFGGPHELLFLFDQRNRISHPNDAASAHPLKGGWIAIHEYAPLLASWPLSIFLRIGVKPENSLFSSRCDDFELTL
jgi:hypothetical protein